MAEARLVGIDTVASGNWIGKRGRAGWIFATGGDPVVKTPSWLASATFASGGGVYYPSSLSPQLPGGGTTAWSYGSGAGLITLTTTAAGADAYLTSLYFYDMGNNMSVVVTAQPKGGGATLASASASAAVLAATGAWIVFACRGDVDLVVDRSSGSWTTLNSVLFDLWPQGFAGLDQGFFGHGVF